MAYSIDIRYIQCLHLSYYKDLWHILYIFLTHSMHMLSIIYSHGIVSYISSRVYESLAYIIHIWHILYICEVLYITVAYFIHLWYSLSVCTVYPRPVAVINITVAMATRYVIPPCQTCCSACHATLHYTKLRIYSISLTVSLLFLSHLPAKLPDHIYAQPPPPRAKPTLMDQVTSSPLCLCIYQNVRLCELSCNSFYIIIHSYWRCSSLLFVEEQPC